MAPWGSASPSAGANASARTGIYRFSSSATASQRHGPVKRLLHSSMNSVEPGFAPSTRTFSASAQEMISAARPEGISVITSE